VIGYVFGNIANLSEEQAKKDLSNIKITLRILKGLAEDLIDTTLIAYKKIELLNEEVVVKALEHALEEMNDELTDISREGIEQKIMKEIAQSFFN
jgi:ribosomal protein L17